MSNTVRSGYMGLANIGGTKVRCTSFSVNPTHNVQFYNHVIGLKDTIPTNSATKGENLGLDYANIQRRIWRPSTIAIGGGISFPATETSLKDIFTLARYANYFDLDFIYYCYSDSSEFNSKSFKNCRFNGFDFNITAGDILNISTDVVAKSDTEGNVNFLYKTPEKLITWDQVSVIVTNAPFNVKSILINGFSFKINNNIQAIYTAGTERDKVEALLPYDLRVGMQEISGSISIFLNSGQEYIPINTQNPSIITVSLPNNLTLKMTVVFESNQMEGQVGPIINNLPFVGVDYTFS